MTRLRFEPVGAVEQRLLDRVYVEVLDDDLAPVTRALMSETIELAPGAYAVRATLPDGSCVAGAARVPESGEVAVRLSPVMGAGRMEVQRDTMLERLSNTEFSDIADLGANIGRSVSEWGRNREFRWIERTQVRLVSGNPFKGPLRSLDSARVYHVGETFNVSARPEQTFLQLKDPTVRIAVPIQPTLAGHPPAGINVTMIERRGKAWPQFVFDNPDLDLLVRYVSTGLAGPISVMAGSDALLLAERAFRQSPPRPFSAIAGAYAMLRLGDTKKLAHWTEDFAQRFDWFADAAIVRAEVLARMGAHQRALECLMTVPERGAPFVATGLSLALARLHQYEAAAKRLELPNAFARVLRQLTQLAGATDFSCPILTWRLAEFQGVDDDA